MDNMIQVTGIINCGDSTREPISRGMLDAVLKLFQILNAGFLSQQTFYHSGQMLILL